jgi:hypothetical protein
MNWPNIRHRVMLERERGGIDVIVILELLARRQAGQTQNRLCLSWPDKLAGGQGLESLGIEFYFLDIIEMD